MVPTAEPFLAATKPRERLKQRVSKADRNVWTPDVLRDSKVAFCPEE
jgi:hypothetical protein